MPNEIAERPRIFIDKVHLKGFKSIEDVSVDFKKGLNILIGKNGSGKSNFLELVDQVVNNNRFYNYLFEFAKIDFCSEDNHSFVLEFKRHLISVDYVNDPRERITILEKFSIDKDVILNNSPKQASLNNIKFKNREIRKFDRYRPYIFRELGYSFGSSNYIKFNLPTELNFIQQSGTLKLGSDTLFGSIEYPIALNFLTSIFEILAVNIAVNKSGLQNVSINDVNEFLNIKPEIIDNIKRYTPIEDLRFNQGVNLYHDEKGLIIDNVKLEFKINKVWMPWSQLSDGTKRLFYIVSEITHSDSLILIEEPELGIHPHQFNLLMDFLKEQSEHKQILISTHSPKALDHLSPEELDSILIASFDLKKGTQIRHLTAKEINKAKKYMKEVGFFSDYWMLSDLEE